MLNKPLVVTVSQLNRKVALLLGAEKTFENLSVKGEISNFKLHDKTGHMFFSLKDETDSLKVVLYKHNAENLKFVPKNGMSVIVSGSVKCYAKDGIYQLYAYRIVPDGIGEQALAFEQLKEKLKSEGLFDRKRALPVFPKKICIITSETGAALQDILNILQRRYPVCEVLTISTLVQGDNAPDSIVSSFETAQKTDSDIIIFGRGGGSSEDLAAFNSEKVVRAVYNSNIPTISAVGHEIDYSLSDFAADLRAPTPSAAAELAVPEIRKSISIMENSLLLLKQRALSAVSRHNNNINLIFSEIRANTPLYRLEKRNNSVSALERHIKERFNIILLHKEQLLSEKTAVISALNPLAVLMRGYSIVYKDGKTITDKNKLKSGDKITIRLNEGEISATVD